MQEGNSALNIVNGQDGFDKRLLLALADDLKSPLLQIAYDAELAELTGNLDVLDKIQVLSRNAVADIDAFIIGSRANAGQLDLPLEPIAPSAAINEVIWRLRPIASQNNCKIFLDRAPNNLIAMAHHKTLVHGLYAICRQLITVSASYAKQPEISFSVVKHGNGINIVALQNGDAHVVLKQMMRDGIKCTRSATGSLQLGMGPAAGIYAACNMLSATKMKVAVTKRGKHSGFVISTLSSNQLSLV